MEEIKTLNYTTKRNFFDVIGFLLGWFAIITQFVLMLQNEQAAIPEIIIRFFSFFTILTNLLVVLFFTYKTFNPSIKTFKIFDQKGALTAITTFILIVGIVYQLVLRGLWEPKGLQRIVDEFLHAVIPIYVLIYWIRFSKKEKITFREVTVWLLYPVVYLIFILIRGHFSNHYPYPFVNVSVIGYTQALMNSLLITLFSMSIMGILIFIGRKIHKH